jgi:TolB-like protein
MNRCRFASIPFVVLSLLALSSCAYKGAIKQDFYKSPQVIDSKIPLSVAIDKSRRIPQIKGGSLGFSSRRLTIDVNDPLVIALQDALSSIMEDVQIRTRIDEDTKVDFIIFPRYRATLTAMQDLVLNSSLELQFQNVNSPMEVARYSVDKQNSRSTTALMVSAALLGGGSFFALMPILVPVVDATLCKWSVLLVEKCTSECLDEIIDDIIRDRKRLVYAARKGESSITTASNLKKYNPPLLEIPPPKGSGGALAVLDLKSVGCSQSVGPAVSNAVREILLKSGHYRVLDRSSMDKVLAEQDFQQSGRCDDMVCVVKIGKILAVQKMVGGDVAKLGRSYRITLQIVDVETASVVKISSEGCTCPEDQLFQVAETAAKRLLLP